MVSDSTTRIERGTVQWKPDPKDMPDSGNGAWTSYQLKVNDKYFDCNHTIYNIVRKDDTIEFTYTSKPWEGKGGTSGTRRKIADLIGGETSPDTATPQTASAPRTEPQRMGMIASLPGAEVGAMENRANAIGIALGIAGNIEEMRSVLMNQAYLSSWFKAQQIPNPDSATEPEQDIQAKSARDPNEPDSMHDGPDPTEE